MKTSFFKLSNGPPKMAFYDFDTEEIVNLD